MIRKSLLKFLALSTLFAIVATLDTNPVFANVALQCPTYSVEKIQSATSFERIGCYNTLDEAQAQMMKSAPNVVVRHPSSKSPMKIVAMDRGIIVNVPDRANGLSNEDTTILTIGPNYTDSTRRTYINLYNTMYYFKTTTYNGQFVFNVGISGFNGYIKGTQADLVPMIYLENGWIAYLGGDGNGNQVIINSISPNYYKVTAGSPYNEMSYTFSEIDSSAKSTAITYQKDGYIFFDAGYITKVSDNGTTATYRSTKENVRIRDGASTSDTNVVGYVHTNYTFTGSINENGQWIQITSYTVPESTSKPSKVRGISSYGAAPDWLPVGGPYYSYDGIHFYHDIYMTQPIAGGAEYYNYFQYLPARSETTHTAAQMDEWIRSKGYTDRSQSVMVDLGNAFIQGQQENFMNGLMIYAMAIHESGYGTSSIAKSKYNLFGWNAVDSSPGESASTYRSPEQSVLEHMKYNLNGYLQLSGWRYAGNGLGQKNSGFNKQYASDPYWGLKISNFMYDFDKTYNYTDLFRYTLGRLPRDTKVNVRSGPSTEYPVLYTTNTNPENNALVIVEDQMVIVLGEENGWYKIHLQNVVNGSNTGYITKEFVTLINKSNTNPNPVTVDIPSTIGARVTGSVLHGFNLTTPISTIKSAILAKDATASIVITDVNGTVKDDSAAIATGDNLAVTLTGQGPVSYKIAVKGDINGDGKVSNLDFVMIQRDLLSIAKLTGYQSIAGDLNADGKVSNIDFVTVQRDLLGIAKIY